MVEMKDNMLGLSWHDSAWVPILNPSNVMDYFSERSNPFYDKTCNNEIIKMQRLSSDQLNNMTGLEYVLLHVQDPILYVVRKQHRFSISQVTPLADYYIIAGVVYQAPDLGAVINSRVLSSVHHLQSAFGEAQSFSRYHPSKGYWWDFGDKEPADKKGKPKDKTKEEISSEFQRNRVDVLLGELAKKFPPKFPPPPQPEKIQPVEEMKVDAKVEVKTERPDSQMSNSQPPVARNTKKPPPEKRPRVGS